MNDSHRSICCDVKQQQQCQALIRQYHSTWKQLHQQWQRQQPQLLSVVSQIVNKGLIGDPRMMEPTSDRSRTLLNAAVQTAVKRAIQSQKETMIQQAQQILNDMVADSAAEITKMYRLELTLKISMLNSIQQSIAINSDDLEQQLSCWTLEPFIDSTRIQTIMQQWEAEMR